MKVREAMTAWPYTVTVTDPLASAVQLMGRKGIHQLPVVQGNRIVGILTDGDVRVALGPQSRRTPLAELDAADGVERDVGSVMTPTLLVISPDEALSVAARQLAKARVGAMPVIDDDGDVIGILSVTDVLVASVEALELQEA